MVKRLPTTRETWVQSLGREDPLEKEMATHSSILAWRIPWTKEPGGQQSMGSQDLDMTRQSLVAQMVKRLPTMRETLVQSLGWEDPLEKEMAPLSSILGWKTHGQRSLEGSSPWGRTESDPTEGLSLMSKPGFTWYGAHTEVNARREHKSKN